MTREPREMPEPPEEGAPLFGRNPVLEFLRTGSRRVEEIAILSEGRGPALHELLSLANVSGHLTPQLLGEELRKLKPQVPVYLYGGKPKHLETIRQQVRALKRRDLHMLVQGKTYRF